MKARTLYEMLEVDPTASLKEIKLAFRKQVKKCHPDTSESNGSSAVFRIFQEAYGILSDPKKRARYDQSLGIRKHFGLASDVKDNHLLQGLDGVRGHSMQHASFQRNKLKQALQYLKHYKGVLTDTIRLVFRNCRYALFNLTNKILQVVAKQRAKIEKVTVYDLQSLPISPGEVVKVGTPEETSNLSELLSILRHSLGENQNVYRATLVELTFPRSEREPTFLVAMHAGMRSTDNVVLFPESALPPDRPLFMLAGSDPFSEVVIERGLEFYPRAL